MGSKGEREPTRQTSRRVSRSRGRPGTLYSSGQEQEGVKAKVLLVLALYFILGLLIFFNLGFHHYLFEKNTEKKIMHMNYQGTLDRYE